VTPLARQLARKIAKPKPKSFWSEAQNQRLVKNALDHSRFYEMTALLPLLQEMTALQGRVDGDAFIGQLVFPPASQVWFEYRYPFGMRIALQLLTGERTAFVSVLFAQGASGLGWVSLVSDDFHTKEGLIVLPKPFEQYGQLAQPGLLTSAHLFLVLINSPERVEQIEYDGWIEARPRASGGDDYWRGDPLAGSRH
jgi:hypothetical protein